MANDIDKRTNAPRSIIDEQKDKQTDRKTEKHTNRQTDIQAEGLNIIRQVPAKNHLSFVCNLL